MPQRSAQLGQRIALAVLSATAIAAIFVLLYERETLENEQQRVTQYARFLSPPLWNLDEISAEQYLNVLLQAHGYEYARLRHPSGEEFVKATAETVPAPVERTLRWIGLIHRERIESPVYHGARLIGHLDVVWVNRNIYLYLYAFVVVSLLTFGLQTYLAYLRNQRALNEFRLEREIGARRQYQQAYEESETRYERLLELSPQAIVIEQDGAIGYINPAGVRLFGASSPADLAGRSISSLIPMGYRDRISLQSGSPGDRDQTGVTEQRFVRLDGQEVAARVLGAPILFQEEPANLLVIADETRERQLEEQLRQAQKMEAVGRLAGGIAHDFNNLLFAINGYAQLIISRAEDPALREDAMTILRAGHNAAELTRRLLAFGRRQVLLPRVLDVNETVGSLEKMLRRLIGEDIALNFELGEDVGHVSADPGALEQVIVNLAVNSRDAMPDGGSLKIATSSRHFEPHEFGRPSELTPGDYALLIASDTGHGMDARTQSHMFEPFFTTKGPGKGTGLGLSTVYGIIKQSGGHIEVASKPGNGTTIRIYLPRIKREAERPTGSETPYTELPRGSETILVCEDEELVRRLICKTLGELGYRVIEAPTTEEAIKAAAERTAPIDLLVTDVIMPQLSGPQLAEQVLKHRPRAKVLYITGYADETVIQHGVVDAGMPLLQKPFSIEVFAQYVREILDGRLRAVKRSAS